MCLQVSVSLSLSSVSKSESVYCETSTASHEDVPSILLRFLG